MAFRSNASCFLILTSNALPIRHKPPEHISVPSLLQHADNEQKAPEIVTDQDRARPASGAPRGPGPEREPRPPHRNPQRPRPGGPGTSHGTPHNGTETRDPAARASPRPWTRQHPEQEAPPRSPDWSSLPKPLSGTSFGKVGAFFKIRATLKRKP